MAKSRNPRAAVAYRACVAVQFFLLATFALIGAFAAKSAPAQTHFPAAQQGVDTLIKAVRDRDMATLQAALGPEGEAILSSGDPVEDNEGRERFLTAYDQSNKLVAQTPTKASLEIGNDAWPFPIPLVKDAQGWRFDTAAGREELLNRRIGRNELYVIQSGLAYVDAQRDYATYDRDGDKLLEYAQRFRSTPNQKDGLYWDAKDNEPESPLGDAFAAAAAKGYDLAAKPQTAEPASYHGYRYKILTAQGAKAEGGAFDYVVKGNLIGGFALVAYPTTYGNSGVMTFVVNHDGTVFQKDLGDDSAKIAGAMTKYDPDQTWKKQDPRMVSAE